MLSVKIKKNPGNLTDGRGGKAIDVAAVAGEDASLSGNISAGQFALDVEFDAPPGVTILFGASGSGKTMTLKCVAGIIRPDSGQISIGGETLFDSGRNVDLPIRKRGVGYVFQNLALFPHLPILENVSFGMSDLPHGERRERALSMMKALRIEHTRGRRPRDISGGEAQRAALARALASRPRILLLDEPLSAIDEATKHGVISDLKAINRELRLPIIYVTHSREEAVTLGERVIVYEHGRVVARGEPLEVFGSPVTSSVARLTGAGNVFEGIVIAKDERGGTVTVEVTGDAGSCLVEAPFSDRRVGERVKIAVPSGDILLASQEPRFTSARNILRGHISSIEDKATRTLVHIESGVGWHVTVTRQAVKELQLATGMEVWLAFKTYSCYLLDE